MSRIDADCLLDHIETVSAAVITEEDLFSFADVMVGNSLIPSNIAENLKRMHESVPRRTKCRYLIWSVFKAIRNLKFGMNDFIRALFELSIGEKLATGYYNKSHQQNSLEGYNKMETLFKMFRDKSYGDSTSENYSQTSLISAVQERRNSFMILFEARGFEPSQVNAGSRWEKNNKILETNCPILCIEVANITAQGTYTFFLNNLYQFDITLNIDCFLKDHISVLVEQYKCDKVTMADKDAWPQVSQTTYINLAVVKSKALQNVDTFTSKTIHGDADDVYMPKGEINYKDAFEGVKHGESVVVEGRPGSGKTTLVHKISQDWANMMSSNYSGGDEESLNWCHIRALFLIHLRGFRNDPTIELVDLIKCYYSNPETIRIMCDYITLKEGLGICFILDGLDEYLPTNKDNFLFKLIRKKVLFKSVIIVASRPAAVAKYRLTSKRIEVLGFFKKQIFEYIDSYNFSGNLNCSKSMLKQNLIELPNVYHMCYLPIQLAMICFLFDLNNGTLPETETAIYEEFTRHTILRSLYRIDEKSGICIESIFSLPELERELFLSVCTLAYQKTISSVQILEQLEVERFCGKMKNSFGLLTIDRAATRCGFQNLYTFCHLTLQEFLAACHIFLAKKQHQCALVEDCLSKKHMVVVLKFFCGLVDLKRDDILFYKIIRSDINCLTKIQCVFESQATVACDYLINKNCISVIETFLSARDWIAFGFVLCGVDKKCVKIFHLEVKNMTEDCVSTFTKKIKDKPKCLDNVEIVLLSGSKHLLDFINIFCSLCFISFVCPEINTSTEDMLIFFSKNHHSLEVVHFQELQKSKFIIKYKYKDLFKTLLFSLSEIRTTSCTSILVDLILRVIGAQHDLFVPHLTGMCSAISTSELFVRLSSLNDCSISEESIIILDAVNIDNIINDLKFYIVATECQKDIVFKKSILRYTNFILTNGYVILLLLDVRKIETVFKIYIFPITNLIKLNFNKILTYTMQEFVKHLVQFKQLQALYISNCDIQSFSIINQFCHLLNGFELEGSCIREEEQQILCLVLESCSNLVFLSISREVTDYIPDLLKSLKCKEQIISLISLEECSINCLSFLYPFTLDTLILTGSKLDSSQSRALAWHLNRWKKLRKLDLSNCHFNKEILLCLIEGIKECNLLCSLDISHNDLGDEGCVLLSEALHHHVISNGTAHLHTLVVRDCGIGDKGINALAGLVNYTATNLIVLDISHNKISMVGAEQITLSLQSCNNLLELGLDIKFLNSHLIEFQSILFLENLITVLQVSDNLQKLLLSNLHIYSTDKDLLVNAIRTLKDLRILKLNNCSSKSTLKLSLEAQRNICSIDISNNKYTVQEFEVLCKDLQSCKFLSSLNLSGTSILPNKLWRPKNMFLVLNFPPSIQELYLDNMNLNLSVCGLATEIKQCKKLQKLSVCSCDIDDDGAMELVQTAKTIPFLETLDLRYNKVSKECIEFFFSHSIHTSFNLKIQ